MPEWSGLGKVLIGLGAGIALVGLLLLALDRVPGLGTLFGWFGRLPGDISIKRENFSFYFPIATSLLLSIIVSLLLFVITWLFRR